MIYRYLNDNFQMALSCMCFSIVSRLVLGVLSTKNNFNKLFKKTDNQTDVLYTFRSSDFEKLFCIFLDPLYFNLK